MKNRLFTIILSSTIFAGPLLRAADEAPLEPAPEVLAQAEAAASQEAEKNSQEAEAASTTATPAGANDTAAAIDAPSALPSAEAPAQAAEPRVEPVVAQVETVEETSAEISTVAVDPAAAPEAAAPEEPVWAVEPYAEAGAAPLAAAPAQPESGEAAKDGAQTGEQTATRIASTPTGNVVVNLINKLVERGVLNSEDARTMVTQAQAEAEAQKVQNESDMFAIAQIAAVQTMTDQALAEQSGVSAVEASRREMEASMNVTYIPAPVREQLAADIRRELAAEGVSVGGGDPQIPPGLPALLAKLRPEGEIRFRYEADLYPSSNSDLNNAFINFNAINTGSPINMLPSALQINPPPQWNTDQNRNRYRLLVRLGTGIELGDNFSAGIRVATGENNSPVTANQSFGLANQGQGGQFSKYAIWLDRAFIRYDLGGGDPESGMLAVGAPYSMVGPGAPGSAAGMTLWFGRFDNPFFSTPIIFDNDLGFDGAAIRLTYNYEDVVVPSVVAGAFPVFNTDLNFSSNQAQKYPSYDKYLFAIQGGTQVNITRNWSAQVAGAYYYFYNIEGKLSSPYIQYSEDDAGDTDNSRPSFAQKGNTYRTLRNLIVPPGFTSLPMDYQYFGLATPFQNLALTGKLSYDGWDPVRVSLIGEYVRNVAFNSSEINEVAVNNLGTDGEFEGNPNAWLVDLEAGHAELDRLGAWQMSFGYRWIGSDAVVDGFNDSDFGLGGTNMKGFTAAARLALTPHVYLALRWFGSESIAGPQYDMNIFQLDLGAKF